MNLMSGSWSLRRTFGFPQILYTELEEEHLPSLGELQHMMQSGLSQDTLGKGLDLTKSDLRDFPPSSRTRVLNPIGGCEESRAFFTLVVSYPSRGAGSLKVLLYPSFPNQLVLSSFPPEAAFSLCLSTLDLYIGLPVTLSCSLESLYLARALEMTVLLNLSSWPLFIMDRLKLLRW